MSNLIEKIENKFSILIKLLLTYQNYMALNENFSLFNRQHTFSDGNSFLYRDTINKINFGYMQRYVGVDTYVPSHLLKYAVDEHHLMFPFIQGQNICGIKNFIIMDGNAIEIIFYPFPMKISILEESIISRSYPNKENIRRWLERKIRNTGGIDQPTKSITIPLYEKISARRIIRILEPCQVSNVFMKNDDDHAVLPYIDEIMANILSGEYETRETFFTRMDGHFRLREMPFLTIDGE